MSENDNIRESWLLRRAFIRSFTPFIVSRLLILLILVFVIQFHTSSSTVGSQTITHPQIELVNIGEIYQKLEKILMIADASWYESITTRGYRERKFSTDKQENWAFFPLYPICAKYLSKLTGSFFLSGFIISNLCFWLGLTLLYRLAELYGYGEAVGARAIWFVSFFPTSYFFSAPVTESLFFFLTVLAFYQLKRGNVLCTGLVFAFLTASRPTGLLLLPALAVAFVEQGKRLSVRALLALLIAPLGGIVFSYYLYQKTGNFLAWADIHAAWGRSTLWNNKMPTFGSANLSLLMTDWNFRLLHFISLALALFATVVLLRRKAFALALIVAIPLLAAISSGTMLSVSRFLPTLYPVFLILALFAEKVERERLILATFAAILSIMTVLFGFGVTAALA